LNTLANLIFYILVVFSVLVIVGAVIDLLFKLFKFIFLVGLALLISLIGYYGYKVLVDHKSLDEITEDLKDMWKKLTKR
jgi:uncharacterized membrane protein (DUF106 family)